MLTQAWVCCSGFWPFSLLSPEARPPSEMKTLLHNVATCTWLFFFFFPSVPIPAATGNYSFSCPVVWLSNSDKIVLELPPSLFLNPFINEPKNQSKRRNPSFSMTIQCFSLKPRLASHLGLHSWSVEIVIVVFAPPMTLPEEAMLPAIVVTS